MTANAVEVKPEKVVYLLGAGATHGCADYLGSDVSLIMPGLTEPLGERMRQLYLEKFPDDSGIRRLVNDVVTEETDFEQIITFLDDAISERYRDFAGQLREIFSSVLRSRLAEVRRQYEERHSELYAALLDMHRVPELGEELRGFLTLNYDGFLEHAIEKQLGDVIDYGIDVNMGEPVVDIQGRRSIPVLKLHGSFGWSDGWPISVAGDDSPGYWIAPGIRKEKVSYPFNAIWGRAREILDCDVLRVIGCNLGANDWDLVSMLFTTMHTHATRLPYRIEIVAGPETADKISRTFPYLNVLSLLEVPRVGAQIVSEVTGGSPAELADLPEHVQAQARAHAQTVIGNPFEYWLRIRGELIDSTETASGFFSKFMDSGT